MYYVYVLKVALGKGKDYYVGYCSDLKKQLAQHQSSEVKTTKNGKPELVYYEAYNNQYLALAREKGLKTSGSVKMALMKRLGLK